MLFSDLTLILTIMINTLILNHSSEAGITDGKGQHTFYPRGVLKHFNYLDVNEKSQRTPGRNGRTNKATKMRQKNLDPIKLQLAYAIDKYEGKRGLIESLYSGVKGCGLNKCEKFHGLIPENQLMRHVKCFRENFQKMISHKLLKFHRGVRIIEKSYRNLIYFEQESRFNNRSRLTLLEELKTDMIMLNLETETVMTNQRLNFTRHLETPGSFRLPHPDNETHLMINEWRIIQDSKLFLRDWQENFEKIFKCWKKRRQKKKKAEDVKIRSWTGNHLRKRKKTFRI